MLGVMQSGGWLMVPILLCSVAALAIGIERGWTLHSARVLPQGLLADAQRWVRDGVGEAPRLGELAAGSPLGQVLAAGVANARRGRSLMKEAMTDAIAAVSHDLERYLTSLGIIASISPLLGLLGTVVGMIQVFSALMLDGAGRPETLAGGISEALITTAAGLTVAIPSLMLHRFFLRRVDDLVVELERQATHLVDATHGDSPPSASGQLGNS
ncbi:MAG: MotA/TolQ/ExbB proton channel family protein [Gammaproteobacteria bacterium]|nr:MotA/TolQ/ExbB proton channel family protein [Gammaproteobacteria bacterium]MDD9963552.1 MotA/TolQ/ExbB proton channel family protein [Gammaproteobacteria bacterium]MDE0269586.1 MotA/TolQ/ExbB proton channel family protein [Gammaproteobacteria bacterium]